MALSATSAAATSQQLFGPYGGLRYATGNMLMPTAKGYTGQYADAASSGLDYYGARYYDPLIGQFASADSAADGLNRYGYVAGNPETATDPTGHRVCADASCDRHGGGGGGSGSGSGGDGYCNRARCHPHGSKAPGSGCGSVSDCKCKTLAECTGVNHPEATNGHPLCTDAIACFYGDEHNGLFHFLSAGEGQDAQYMILVGIKGVEWFLGLLAELKTNVDGAFNQEHDYFEKLGDIISVILGLGGLLAGPVGAGAGVIVPQLAKVAM